MSHIQQVALYCVVYTWLKKCCLVKSINQSTMRHYGILGKQQGTLVTPFHLLVFKVIFYSWKDFGVYLSVLFFPCHYDVHGVWESKQVLSLPRKPLGRIVHCLCFYPTTFFQLGVYKNVQPCYNSYCWQSKCWDISHSSILQALKS